jgi:RecB family endonuclease NucS
MGNSNNRAEKGMQEDAFGAWMIRRNTDADTLGTRLSTVRRVEAAYGDLDAAYAAQGMDMIMADLTYSKVDQRNHEPNPSKPTISGDIYNGLASARTHLASYRQFLEARATLAEVAETVRVVETAAVTPDPAATATADPPEAILSMERDLSAALRQSITQLEWGLSVIDGGREHTVTSGRIDILAEDGPGHPVVPELKAVTAPRDAVAQVLSYMGDMAAETGKPVRGYLIAPDFDPRAVSAARMVPNLRLVGYRFNFMFSPVTTGTGSID